MADITESILAERWFPVARSEEVLPRNVAQTQLLGQEIVLWRDDAGLVNAWENRCPHRGVRLSIGFNLGGELRCQYHGWRYASGSGRCTFIPAHPDQKPASIIRAKPYAAIEQYGLVWVNLAGGEAAAPVLGINAWTSLRGIFVAAPVAPVAEALGAAYGASPAPDGLVLAGEAGTEIFLLQPVTDRETMIHGLLAVESAGPERLAVLCDHNARLTEIRDAVEREAVR
jgi:nitrite reductase/ring-hydroxylating ferredoxin subunit